MLIPCETCQSIFQLDSSLVKPTGTKVRCSKCRTIFKVYPPEPVDRRKYPRVATRNLMLVLAATDLEGNIIEVKGRLIYCAKTAPGTYHSGIEFIGVDKRVTKFIAKLIKGYKYRGYNLFIAIARKLNKLQSKRISGEP